MRHDRAFRSPIRGLALAALLLIGPARAVQLDIAGPAGSVSFGFAVTALPNGNIVVTDPYAPPSNAGAVYLYDVDGAPIATLTGSHADDQVGRGGIRVVANGNFVVDSPSWNGGAGAVTWVDGRAGLSGAVSASNSLVGGAPGDLVGSAGVVVLTNGDYVVVSPQWSGGAASHAGAATWADGASGIVGAVSAANSLVGASADDEVGSGGVTALTNGNYVVRSASWRNGATPAVGAATWANGSTGRAGAVSPANSLIGASANDRIGSSGVFALANGNYVVASEQWDDAVAVDAGAATWASGSTGLVGVVSAANSLVGALGSDRVGNGGVTALANGNFVVVSRDWNNGAIGAAGAATWRNGAAAAPGVVSAANSLVGGSSNDHVGNYGVTALANGHYVVQSPGWDAGAVADVGAATWGDGLSGTTGVVSAGNSLVGSAAGDQVGTGGVTALANGNYVVASPNWDDGASANVGAVTWASGAGGLGASVAAANSLIGTTPGDLVGSAGVAALANGHYVVASPYWDDGATADVGAVTWADGAGPTAATVAAANSLVGTSTEDAVGYDGVTALTDGGYVVASEYWNDGMTVQAGAVTRLAGAAATSASVSAANSLVGGNSGDRVGTFVAALPGGNYAVRSAFWRDGANPLAGAVSLGRPGAALAGAIDAGNSVRGSAAGGGPSLVFAFDPVHRQLVVGQPADKRVTIFDVDLVFKDGYE